MLRWVASIVASALVGGYGSAQTPGEQISWRPGDAVTRIASKSKPDVITLSLTANVFVRMEVVQNGADLVATLRNPRGETLLVADSANGRDGPETIAWIARSSGAYSVEVRQTDGPADQYAFHVLEMRPAADADIEVVQGFQAYYEGCAAPNSTSGRQQAFLRLNVALETFRKLKDPHMEALTVFTIGATFRAAGDFRHALSDFEGAAVLLKSTSQRGTEALALNSAGGAADVLGEPHLALRHYRSSRPLSGITRLPG